MTVETMIDVRIWSTDNGGATVPITLTVQPWPTGLAEGALSHQLGLRPLSTPALAFGWPGTDLEPGGAWRPSGNNQPWPDTCASLVAHVPAGELETSLDPAVTLASGLLNPAAMTLDAGQPEELVMRMAPALACSPDPDLTAVYVRPATTGSPRLPILVQRMLELFDGSRSVDEICARVQIPETKGLAIVRKLSSQGLIRPLPPGENQTALSELERQVTLRDLPSLRSLERTGFSAAEEAFFASEVAAGEDDPIPSLGEKASLFISDLILRLRGAAL